MPKINGGAPDRTQHSTRVLNQSLCHITPDCVRAHLAPRLFFKERTIENFEPSEVLAQGSALARQRNDDPQSDHCPPQLSSSMSRAALQAVVAVWLGLERGRLSN
jgi:hypothetical protein